MPPKNKRQKQEIHGLEENTSLTNVLNRASGRAEWEESHQPPMLRGSSVERDSIAERLAVCIEGRYEFSSTTKGELPVEGRLEGGIRLLSNSQKVLTGEEEQEGSRGSSSWKKRTRKGKKESDCDDSSDSDPEQEKRSALFIVYKCLLPIAEAPRCGVMHRECQEAIASEFFRLVDDFASKQMTKEVVKDLFVQATNSAGQSEPSSESDNADDELSMVLETLRPVQIKEEPFEEVLGDTDDAIHELPSLPTLESSEPAESPSPANGNFTVEISDVFLKRVQDGMLAARKRKTKTDGSPKGVEGEDQETAMVIPPPKNLRLESVSPLETTAPVAEELGGPPSRIRIQVPKKRPTEADTTANGTTAELRLTRSQARIDTLVEFPPDKRALLKMLSGKLCGVQGCDIRETSLEGLVGHQRMHHLKKSFKSRKFGVLVDEKFIPGRCPVLGCNLIAEEWGDLKEHVGSVHAEVCFDAWKEHVRRKICMATNDCGFVCLKEATMRDHMLTKHSDKALEYPCSKCNKVFSSRKLVLDHFRRIHSGRDDGHECPYCPQILKRNKCLMDHIRRLHTLERPFECDICHKTFLFQGGLDRHKRTAHDKVRDFICDICNKGFLERLRLEDHKKMRHSKEKPFKCDQCSAAFAVERQLKFHLMDHTGEKPFKCGVCGDPFKYRRTLNKHVRKQHPRS